MKQIQITIPIEECKLPELAQEDRELVEAAMKATDGSYAPYSHFHVGAAIRMEDGTVVTGANQENAAFSSGTCGERSACFAAGAHFPGMAMRAIAIAARTDNGLFQAKPISPCGACRQVLLEYETLAGGPVPVILVGTSRILIFPSVRSLLPYCFAEF